MTSPRATDTNPATATDLTGLHELLWQLRRDNALVRRLDEEPTVVCDDFDVPSDVARHVCPLDVPALLRLGTNPYLLFFAALELGVARADYYAQLTRAADRG